MSGVMERVENLRGKMHFHIAKAESASADFKKADARLVRKYAGDESTLRIRRGDDLERGDAFKAWQFHRDAATMYASAVVAELAVLEREYTRILS
jgi:hypothetical protein